MAGPRMGVRLVHVRGNPPHQPRGWPPGRRRLREGKEWNREVCLSREFPLHHRPLAYDEQVAVFFLNAIYSLFYFQIVHLLIHFSW